MRFTYNVLRYVHIGWLRVKRGVGSVSLFKKKSCGASLCKSETLISRANDDMDRKMIEWGWMKKA